MIKLGILGGGQLAMFACQAAKEIGVKTIVYSDSDDSPAFSYCDEYFCKDYTDQDSLREFSQKVDFITYEFENIPSESLEFLSQHNSLNPTPYLLHVAKNRLREKNFINNLGVKTADFAPIENLEDLQLAAKKFSYQAILKTTELGYDGKGQFVISPTSDLAEIWRLAGAGSCQLILEKKVAFEREVSVVVARDKNGAVSVFPVAHNKHENGILRVSIVPANISSEEEELAKNIAIKIAEAFELVGILAVEMFLLKNGEILVNEIAPRPHNSGHYTIDACNYSQFSEFVRAVTEQEVQKIILEKKAKMYNLIGDEILQEEELKKQVDICFYNYGKKAIKEGRKMGHYTVISAL